MPNYSGVIEILDAHTSPSKFPTPKPHTVIRSPSLAFRWTSKHDSRCFVLALEQMHSRQQV